MKRNLLWLLGFLLLTSKVGAQTGTTSLRGTVSDKTGGVVQGAKVTLSNPVQAVERTGTTSASGAYQFLSLPPGTYSLTVEMTGFRSYQQRTLQLLVDSPAAVNVTLEVGSTTETISVTTQIETLNTSNASLGIAFNENQVKQLPLEGRNIPDLLSLQAGVAVTGNRPFLETRRDVDTRNGAVNGAHSDQSNITLDGVDVNDETRGYAFTSVLPVTLDSVQEFRVTTTNYDADQGRSSGAQVSLVTKSGSNDFHGSAYEYLRNTITSANDYFVKLSELQNGQANVPPKLIRNIFGGSVGGPIRKDRLFFFANYEGARQREENSVLRIVPSLALRDGVVQYLCADPTACPGGTVQGLTGPHQIQPGYQGLSPQDVATLDPLHLPPNPAVVKYFNTFPATGFDTTQGDGVNYVGYRFRGAVPTNKGWYIARLDYKITRSGSHSIFWRGALRNDFVSEPPYLPGQGPQQNLADYSKGFSLGYTAVLRPEVINNFRWGYTRQSFGILGNSDQPFIQFRGLNDDTTSNNSSLQVVRTNVFQVPVHNFTDDISWSRGKHTLQFGANVELLRTSKSNTLSSFSTGIANPNFLPSAAIAGTNIQGDPGATGFGYSFPAVDSSFGTNYDYPFMALLGSVSQVNANYNYDIKGNVLPQGAPLSRHFATNSFEFYAQDSWKVKPNLTFTYGLRYSLFSPPWETNGVEVTPTMNLGDWFNLRAQNMNQGLGAFSDPVVSLDLSGPANGKPGFYDWDYHNFGPRIAVAWAPNPSGGFWKRLLGGAGQSSIRAGFGIVYDRIGQGLLATFDKRGSFGLSTSLTNSNGGETLSTAPRLTDVNTIPTLDRSNNPIFTPAPPGGFPQTPPFGSQNGAFTAADSVDRSVKTPYSYTLDLSVGRELGHDLSIEVSYVGRLSHRLLALEDLAQPTDLVDPKAKIDYFSAVQALAKLYRQGVPASQITPAMVGSTAQYWYDMTQPLLPGGAYSLDSITQSFCTPSFTPTDALQANYALFSCYANNETSATQRIDQNGFPDPNNPGVVYYGNCRATGSIPNCYMNSQYVSLLAWRSVGTASYHALQVNIRKRLSKGVQFELNYTYSKSIDLESDAERVDLSGAGALGFIQNAWRPNQSRGVSDFDTPHQINANWIVELPFGKGRWIHGNAGKPLDAIIGGWQLSGLARWTTGFPVNIGNGSAWPTNWQFNPNATQVLPAVTGTTKNPDGSVNIFPGPQGVTGLGAFAPTLPGESGTRNPIRGDGFAGFDAGLSKRWTMPWKESQSLQFRWEVFNVLNLTRFDVQTITANIDQGSSFGNYSGLSTNPRVMQFALRFEF
jgi:Carboxypeptidase regulatory-like domain/TonB dependent receptor